MKSQLKSTSVMMLVALLLSLVPALVLPSSASAATCDWVQFVADVTVPDGAKYEPGATFKKTWRLKNIGTCTWTTSYSLVFDSGEQMGAPASIKFPSSVAPGQTIDINVDMTAPSKAGHYIGYWKFKNASGVLFGIGANANKAWWVEINVVSGTSGVAYDFTANAASATWSSGAGGLTFPGTDGDAKGFALKKDAPKFESGVTATQAGLLLVPQNITNGFIQARYPAFKVQSGDRFQSTIGCEFGATSCYVAYRLDYEADGAIKTFWSFRERYEGLTYNANLDLSPLAGKEVKFILYISAYGSPSGDRALWGKPVIIRQGSVTPPPPTVTGTPPTATPSKTPAPITPTVPASSCDKVQFIADVNFPDGSILQPGAQFTKTWRLKNVGSCVWSTSYQIVFFSGEKMGAPASALFTKTVAVGETVDVSINMIAPTTPGSYRGYWMFKNASGALFGIGALANKPWWVDIKVTSGPTATPAPPTATSTQGGPTSTPSATPTPLANTAYDFVANACSASWHSGAGAAALPCPGTDGDVKGFVLKVSSPKLETGSTDSRPGLLTFPQNVQDGYIQGFYPAFNVQNGDRFQSTINCEYGASGCYVVFRLDYQTGTDPIKTYWGPFLERYEGKFFDVDVDLTPLAGKDVKFILTILAAGSSAGDRALWVGPRIYRPGGATATPVVTPGSASGPYGVVYVKQGDVLNVRSGPGVNNPVVSSFPPSSIAVMRTGPSTLVEGAKWVEVNKTGGGTGWVNAYYLTEYKTSADFCGDAKVTTLLNDFKAAVLAADGTKLSTLVSPVHGVDIYNVWYGKVVNFTAAQAAQAYTSTTSVDWGAGFAGSPNVVGTFKDVIQPKLLDVFNSTGYTTVCDAPKLGNANFQFTWPTHYANMHYYSLHKPGTPGTDLDWRTWVAGVEYAGGQPYIFSLMQLQWEP